MNTPSVEPVVRSRLLPRVSFRLMLGLTAAVAIFFALAQAAGEGWAFAIAIQVAIGFLVACFALFAIVFLIAWTVSTAVLGNKPDTPQGSPFAADQLPPQIIPPREQRP